MRTSIGWHVYSSKSWVACCASSGQQLSRRTGSFWQRCDLEDVWWEDYYFKGRREPCGRAVAVGWSRCRECCEGRRDILTPLQSSSGRVETGEKTKGRGAWGDRWPGAEEGATVRSVEVLRGSRDQERTISPDLSTCNWPRPTEFTPKQLVPLVSLTINPPLGFPFSKNSRHQTTNKWNFPSPPCRSLISWMGFWQASDWWKRIMLQCVVYSQAFSWQSMWTRSVDIGKLSVCIVLCCSINQNRMRYIVTRDILRSYELPGHHDSALSMYGYISELDDVFLFYSTHSLLWLFFHAPGEHAL